MGDLLPNLPEEIRGARIGACYNPLTRSLMYRKNVIAPQKLDSKAILMVNGGGGASASGECVHIPKCRKYIFCCEFQFENWKLGISGI